VVRHDTRHKNTATLTNSLDINKRTNDKNDIKRRTTQTRPQP